MPIPTFPSYVKETKSVVGFANVLPPTIVNVLESVNLNPKSINQPVYA